MRSLIHRLLGAPAPAPAPAVAAAPESVESYWTRHNVTAHHAFTTAEESAEYLAWRNDQYYGYAERMPLHGHDDRVVVDFGCGPGHDLVGFAIHSRPRRLVGIDVSPASLAQARARLALHGAQAELVQASDRDVRIPCEDGSVDYLHCSGVLHHTSDPAAVLAEFRRVLAPGGHARLMVYNYESLWLHLYVAWQKLIEEGRYAGLDIRAAFARTTDGEECPIARVQTPAEVIADCAAAGLAARYLGAAISTHEMSLLPLRFRAIADRRLRAESRRFLAGLEFDARGLPLHAGHVAGVDACFELRHAGAA